MSFRAELNKHLTALPVGEVKKLVSKYNKELDIKPISKLKKAEIIEKIKSKKPMDKQLLAKLTNEARATVEGRKAQKASEKEDAKKKKEEPKKKVIKVKKSKNQPPKAKPDFLDLDKDGDKKEPMKKAAKEAKKSKPKKENLKDKAETPTNYLKFDTKKLKISENKNFMNQEFYNIFYNDNNVRIDGLIPPKKPTYFYLETFMAQEDKTQPRAAKGQANFYLCELLKSLLQIKFLNLKPTSEFKLTAGNISDGHNQSKLNKYYEGLGFKKDGTAYSSGSQDYKQTIASFMKNCEKFKNSNKEPKNKMPSGVHIHLDGKTMKYNSVKEGQASFDKIRSNRAKKPYKKMTLMDGDKILDYSA